MEFPGGVCGGVSISVFVDFSASDEGLLLLSITVSPLLVKEGWEPETFSKEGPADSMELI
jgi:hypothetical protein